MLAELLGYVKKEEGCPDVVVSQRVPNHDLTQVLYRCPMLGTILKSGDLTHLDNERVKFTCKNCGLIHVVKLRKTEQETVAMNR